MAVHPPVTVALARAAPPPPDNGRWAWETKMDGWRAVLFASYEGETLIQTRTGHTITQALPELAEAATQLPSAAVLDGEAVVYAGGHIDRPALQRRARSQPRRSAALRQALPVSYLAFDLIQDPDGHDLRPRPYAERRARLLGLLTSLAPDTPILPMPATSDYDVARAWWNQGQELGIEGLIAKHVHGSYRAAARDWRKIKYGSPCGLL
ncbi:ATP-dependent DNA ligase [Streptomyces diacarni]|uniref:ATP-dependent DNA ligase n=1 Tax=Streptomyces diacarni TaxID=2800381 RepID=UPI0033E073C4